MQERNDSVALERSALYQELISKREEILRHKWLESQKVGHDVGLEQTLFDWIRHHRNNWRNARR
jgi:hypothetical protein